MNERQRKVLLVIAAREAEGKSPCIRDIARINAMNEISVADDLRDMEVMGLLVLGRTSRQSGELIEARLTPKAKRLLPRVREIS